MREKNNKNDKLVELEINKLKSAINEVNIEKSADQSLKWSDFTASPTPKAFTIGIVVVALSQFNGCVALQNYSANIFQKAGSNLSPNTSSIVIGNQNGRPYLYICANSLCFLLLFCKKGAIQLLGSFVSSILVDRAGRKV